MKSVHEWERVICAASQGNKIGIDCSDTNEFGGPSMGFPHSNGREAADPFDGKDLNTFEYEKETGPSLGIKIDLIADWVVTQARSCPTSCGNSARNFSGSVRCSTGDDADCDPNTKPAIPTRSCGKTADCPTYTGTWIKGSCPSGCGQSRGYKTVSVSCSGGNCNPSARPSTSRWCQATPPCVVNCQVSTWGGWTDTSNWGSCSANCGGGTQTKSQRRTRTITTQPQHGGRACPALTETQSVSRSCNTHSCACPAKPRNSSWDDAVNGGTQPNCDWSCNSGYTENASGSGCVKIINCQWSAWNWGSWSGCSKSCGTGNKTRIATRFEEVLAQNGGRACTGSSSKSETVSCNTQPCVCNPSTPPSRAKWKTGHGTPPNCEWACSGGSSWNSDSSSCVCPTGTSWNGSECRVTKIPCQNSLPANARWLTGHGQFKPNCTWTCKSGFTKSGNGCVPSKKTYRCDAGDWQKISDSCVSERKLCSLSSFS